MRILIVDDDSSTAELIAECLMLEGDASVQIAGNGAEALDACLNNAPHVILLDVGLPDVSGLELAAHLRGLCPDARIIVLSGYGADPEGLKKLPPDIGWLVKPVAYEVLQEHILGAPS